MRALVVGAGTAGCTAAVALARQGLEVVVVEIEPQLRPLGVGLLLQNSPLRALHTLGLADECVARGYVHDEVDLCDRDGRLLRRLAPPSLVPGRPAAVAIARSELAGIVSRAAANAGAELRTGTTVTSLEDLGETVRVRLSDGSRHDVDLLVGADGSHSRTRTDLFPDAPAPRRTGQTIWRAAATRPPGVDRYTMLDAGPEVGKVGVVPLSSDRLYLWMLQRDVGQRRPSGHRAVEMLRELLTPFGGDVPAVSAALEPPVDLRSLQSVLLPLPWARGRCVLIGDAVHTTTPQVAYGVGLAIEDSVVLADCVAEHADVATALAAFQTRRFARCALVVESSVQLGAWELDPPDDPALAGQLMGRTMATLSEPY